MNRDRGNARARASSTAVWAGLSVVCGALLLVGCSSVELQSDYERGVDWSEWKTFQVVEPDQFVVDPNFPQFNEILHRRVARKIEADLEERGYRPVGANESPDFTVRTYFGISREQYIHFYPHYSFLNSYRGRFGLGNAPVSRTVTRSTLSIDFVDTESDMLSWHGAGTKVLEEHGPGESWIELVVSRILSQFPPGAGRRKS